MCGGNGASTNTSRTMMTMSIMLYMIRVRGQGLGQGLEQGWDTGLQSAQLSDHNDVIVLLA